jgi:hypothetical protein
MREPRDHTRGVRKSKFNLTTCRLREIERIIAYRFKSILPNQPAADIFLLQAAKLLRRNLSERSGLPSPADVLDRLLLWAERWAHFAPVEHLKEIVEQAVQQPDIEDADALGKLLALTFEKRTYLKITTIGACDVTKAERARRRRQQKRERDKKRAEQRRREQGVRPRSEFLASSLSASRPWEKEGISRRTWERRRKSELLK